MECTLLPPTPLTLYTLDAAVDAHFQFNFQLFQRFQDFLLLSPRLLSLFFWQPPDLGHVLLTSPLLSSFRARPYHHLFDGVEHKVAWPGLLSRHVEVINFLISQKIMLKSWAASQ